MQLSIILDSYSDWLIFYLFLLYIFDCAVLHRCSDVKMRSSFRKLLKLVRSGFIDENVKRAYNNRMSRPDFKVALVITRKDHFSTICI